MPISRSEMNFSQPYEARRTSGPTSIPGVPGIPTKRTVDKTIPLRKIIKDDTETLETSQPIGTDILSAVQSAKIGGVSFNMIILVVLAATVGYLLIIKKGR